MLPWKQRKWQILPVTQNLSSIYFPLAKFQLVSSNPSLAIIWQMTYTQKLPKLCSATLSCIDNDSSLKKWSHVTSNFTAIIPSRSIRQMLAIFSGIESNRHYRSSGKGKEIRCLEFTFSIKSEITHIHDVVVQWQQRNVT